MFKNNNKLSMFGQISIAVGILILTLFPASTNTVVLGLAFMLLSGLINHIKNNQN